MTLKVWRVPKVVQEAGLSGLKLGGGQLWRRSCPARTSVPGNAASVARSSSADPSR